MALAAGGSPAAHGQATINATNAYAWGANVGWTNWLPSSANGVVIGEYVLSGYVYGANIGWINLGNGSPADHIQYLNNSATDFGVNLLASPVPGFSLLRGFAYGANVGWINFEATGNPQVNLANGQLTGYAYGANIGWINLGTGFLQTDRIAPGIDTNASGLPDAWQYLYFGGLGVDPNASPSGDGETNRQKYLDGDNPLLPGSHLSIISIVKPGLNSTVLLTFTSNTTREYQVQSKTDLTVAGWPDSGLGLFFGDPGSQTSRTVMTAAAPNAPQEFFRVQASLPALIH